MELLQAAEFHNNLLFKMQMEGFSTANYLKARAKLFLAQEDKNNASSKKPTKQKKQKEAKAKAKEEKYALPAEVKHPVLYYRLQEWRRKKALELKVAAFIVLHNKVLLSICAYLPTTAEELLRIVPLRRLGRRAGAERLTLKGGRMVLYFVGNADSPFYRSATFDRIITYATRQFRRCELREDKGHRRMIIRGIAQVEEALRTLREMVEPAEERE